VTKPKPNPRRKPAENGVPMPELDYIECYWAETPDGIEPSAIMRRVRVDFANDAKIAADLRAARKWIANPADPKGVRR
jgi:hypothetical protein